MQKIKVMIIDSEMIDLVRAESALQEGNYEIFCYTSISSIFTHIDFKVPEVVLIDIKMEGMNPHELTNLMKRFKRRTELSVVLYSHADVLTMDSLCKTYALNGFFSKKIEPNHLVAYLDTLFTPSQDK